MSDTDMGYDQDDPQYTMPNTPGEGDMNSSSGGVPGASRRDTMADPAGTAVEDEDVTSDIGDVSGTTRPTDVGATDHTRAGTFDSDSSAAPNTSP